MPNSFATPWTVTYQVPLSMGLPRQEHGRGLPFPSAGELPDPGIKSASLLVDSLPLGHQGSPTVEYYSAIKKMKSCHLQHMVDLENMLSEIDREKQIPYDFTPMWNLKTNQQKHNK